MTRTATGRYQANLAGMSGAGDTVSVTAYGSDNLFCKVVAWAVPTVLVSCFTPAGVPADAAFTLSYSRQFVPNLGGDGAYGWTSGTDGTISPSYSWSSEGLDVSGSDSSLPGVTDLRIAGIRSFGSVNAMITAYGGEDTDSCQVSAIIPDGSGGTDIEVRCYRPDGTPEDTRFTVSYVTSR